VTPDLLAHLRHIQVNIGIAKNRLADLDEAELHPSDATIVNEACAHLRIAARQLRAALSEVAA
jgi:hypothetical protein